MSFEQLKKNRASSLQSLVNAASEGNTEKNKYVDERFGLPVLTRLVTDLPSSVSFQTPMANSSPLTISMDFKVQLVSGISRSLALL